MRTIAACLIGLAAVVAACVVCPRQPAKTRLAQSQAPAAAAKSATHGEAAPDLARQPQARDKASSTAAISVAAPPRADEPLSSSSIVGQLYDSLAHCLSGENDAPAPPANGAFEPQELGKYRDSARELLANLAVRDHPDGYRLLSDAHVAGRIFDRDEITACACHLAWRDASTAPGSSSPLPFAAHLSADQQQQAEALGRAIRGKAPLS